MICCTCVGAAQKAYARAVSEIGLRRGSYEVLGVDAKGRVELKVGSRTVRFDPQRIDPNDKRDALGLTQRTDVKIHENDQIRWTANDKDRGLYNASLAQVTSEAGYGSYEAFRRVFG